MFGICKTLYGKRNPLKIEFQSDLSVVDVLFNLGPETTSYLETQSI